MNTKKLFLFLAIVLSFIIVIPLLDYAKLEVSAILFFAQLFGYVGIHLIFWQVLLSVRTPLVRWFEDLVFLLSVHKNIGKFGILLILLHPILLFLFYSELNINILTISFESQWDIYKFFGQIALYVLLVVWLSSAILRSKLTYRLWKKIHLLSYIILPFVFAHSIFMSKGNAMYYSVVLACVLILVTVYKILQSSTLLKTKYDVINVQTVARNCVEITLRYKKFFDIKPGQFIYVQVKPFGEEHPYTVSKIDDSKSEIAITVKFLGEFSSDLINLLKSQKILSIYVDGPYGVFTREIYDINSNSDIVLIVGGIGITPFVEVFRRINLLKNKKIFLFYFNRTVEDITYKELLDEVQTENNNVLVIHILSDQPEEYDGEKGIFSIDLLKKYSVDLYNSKFFVCGPPRMMDIVLDLLKLSGVKYNNIYFEKFSN